MKFSIIVPVYNTEKYLNECLDSLINQTYRDFEIILVDDGSTDSSSRICDTYAEQNPDKIKVIHKPNGGLISARVTGNKHASGDYILNVDSDDFVSLDLLKTINEKTEEYDSPDMIIYSFVYYSDEKTENRKETLSNADKVFEDESKKRLYECLISNNLITSIWTKAVKRNIIESNPTDYSEYYNRNMAEDLLQTLYPITQSERILYINTPLYFYRYNPNGISRSVSYEMLDKNNTVHVYYEIKRYLKKWGMDNDEYNLKLDAKWLSEAMYTLIRFYLKAKDSTAHDLLLKYDWNSYVPEEALRGFENNPYLSDAYKTVWKMIVNGDKQGLKRYFAKKKIYTGLKRIKRKITG